ncbi:hypothetical protein [Bradyrhizobium sp. NP1]|uniref:His-rich protein BRANT n=1 Tax=Bradyrhizobium sp. NP1 TaxID=3049772 RepID=UPI0025A569EB|nr:hypothetical protein [Bradyrhizobium sp. NP1]WJR75946.1 hypothetical protein QOU61_24625 [Bradyrhizobium sp. NP1]
MLKSISAALLAVSVIAAPALAAGPEKAAQTPATTQSQPAKTIAAKPEATKVAPAKQNVLNANAKMGRHHARHHHHKKMGMIKTHAKVGFKHSEAKTRRG